MPDRRALATAVMWAITVIGDHWRGMLLVALALVLLYLGAIHRP